MKHMVLTCMFALIAACADAATSQRESNVTKSDEVSIQASKETKTKLGVERWGATNSSERTLIRGYDSSGKKIVELDHAVTEDDGTFKVTTAVSDHGKRSVMTADIKNGEKPEPVIKKNELAANDNVKDILDCIEADTRASTTKSSASLRPQGVGSGIGTSGGSSSGWAGTSSSSSSSGWAGTSSSSGGTSGGTSLGNGSQTDLIKCTATILQTVEVVISAAKNCQLLGSPTGASGGDGGASAPTGTSGIGADCVASVVQVVQQAQNVASDCVQ